MEENEDGTNSRTDFSKSIQLHGSNNESPYLHFNIVHPERTHHSKNKEIKKKKVKFSPFNVSY